MTTRSWVEERPGPNATAAILAGLATASLALLAALSLDRAPQRPDTRRPPPVLHIVTAVPHAPAPPVPPLPKARTLVRLPAVRLPEPAIRMVAVPVPRRPEVPHAEGGRVAAAAAPAPHTAFQQPAAPPAPPPAAASPAAVRTLEGEIREAVQEALRYPAASRMMGEEGRSLVGFDYRDRAVSNLRLLASSGIARLDDAALATVRDASYPPPGKAAGRTLSLAVWVTFRLGDG